MSFCFEPGTPEDGSQLSWGLLVGFDFQWVTPGPEMGGAGIDGPGLAALAAPVPGQILNGLIDVVGHSACTWDFSRARLMAT